MPDLNQTRTTSEPAQQQQPTGNEQQQPQPQPTQQPQQDWSNNGPGTIDMSAFMQQATAQRKSSADTIVDEATGEVHTPAPATIASAPLMDINEAGKQAKILIDMRETVQAGGLAWLAEGHIKHFEGYKYDDWQKKLLIEAWTPLVQEMGLRVNKYIQILYAEGISTTPLIMAALKARSFRLENDRLREQIQRMQQAETARNQQPLNPIAPPAPAGWNRMDYDSARKWTVDDNGYFKEGKDGFIKEADRKERPKLLPEVYQMLIKHNGKERIDSIFNV